MKANVPVYNKKTIKDNIWTAVQYTIHAAVLAMNDLSLMSRSPKTHKKSFTFGQKKTDRFVKAVSDIILGYAEEDAEDMLSAMKEELKDRKITITINWR